MAEGRTPWCATSPMTTPCSGWRPPAPNSPAVRSTRWSTTPVSTCPAASPTIDSTTGDGSSTSTSSPSCASPTPSFPALLALPRSRIINIASIAGKKGSFGQAAYNASKHAQIGITRCLAIETGTTGLRVNAVCPGFTETELIDLDELGAAHGRPGVDVWAAVEQAASIKRTVTLDEIADAVCYLAGPLADGVNGQSLVVDGGLHMV